MWHAFPNSCNSAHLHHQTKLLMLNWGSVTVCVPLLTNTGSWICLLSPLSCNVAGWRLLNNNLCGNIVWLCDVLHSFHYCILLRLLCSPYKSVMSPRPFLTLSKCRCLPRYAVHGGCVFLWIFAYLNRTYSVLQICQGPSSANAFARVTSWHLPQLLSN